MTKPAIVDSHCHLDFPDFEGELPEVIARATDAGVTRMVSICTKLREEPQVRAIADAYAPVFFAVGTHPMNAEAEPMATVEQLLEIAKHPKMVGIGETGLDYHYTADTKTVQQESLLIHIEAARQASLPLIIHARAADDDMALLLSKEHKASAFDCVMHCFSSSAELGRIASTLGSTCPCPASRLSRKAMNFATSSPPRPLTAYLWKPTRPTSHRNRIAANETNRHTRP